MHLQYGFKCNKRRSQAHSVSFPQPQVISFRSNQFISEIYLLSGLKRGRKKAGRSREICDAEREGTNDRKGHQ